MAIFFVGANLMTTALKVQSSAVYDYHGPVSLSMSMSNISNKHYLYSNSSNFSTLFGFEVNAFSSRLLSMVYLTSAVRL